MFQVKICGITSVADARLAQQAGADAIGLNFYRESPRFVAAPAAARIAAAVGDQLTVVGVFVNCGAAQIARMAEQVPLDAIQLHGDEPPELLCALAPRPVIRAFRLRDDDVPAVLEYLEISRGLEKPPSAILIDAFEKGSFGGTGKTANWEKSRTLAKLAAPCPLLLAGGLTPENVQDAIRAVGCHGVDVASGVESQPGRKDEVKTKQFVSAAWSALGT